MAADPLTHSPVAAPIDVTTIDELVAEFYRLYDEAEALRTSIAAISQQLAEQAEIFEQIHRHQQQTFPAPRKPWRPRKPR